VARPGGQPAVQVLVPVREAGPQFILCLRGLADHLPANCSVCVFDYGPSGNGVEAACGRFAESKIQLQYARGEECSSLARICNAALAKFWRPGNDLLLLHPEAKTTAGFLEEMQAVLHLHERHAVVAPRTNGHAFLSFPPGDDQSPADAYELWIRLRASLPRSQVVPAVAGFCMLIKSEVLERFGLFDTTPCLDAENDFVRRINRFGYSALGANWAYVFNSDFSFTSPANNLLDAAPQEALTERYPELERKLSDYYRFQLDPLETFSILYLPHRPRILYDLYHLIPQHSGTSDFALNLLREIEPLAREEFDLYVGAGEEQAFFLSELCGYRLHDEKSSLPMLFDLVYKPCQIFRWHEFARMNRLAPRVAFTLLDIIALRCDYIGNASLPPLFRRTVELSDLVFTISEFSHSDLAAFYSADIPMRVIHPASHVRPASGENAAAEHILIMGNARAHKGVSEAVRCLGEDWPIVVVGGEAGAGETVRANVRWLQSGKLSRRLMRDVLTRASVLVYPSYYEGYGLPVADALALGKPVIVLDTSVNREMALQTSDPNLHRLSSLSQLPNAVGRILSEEPRPSHSPTRRWPDAAAEYVAAFRALLGADIDLHKMRRRWDTVRLIESLGSE
jgi:glycosyltransferase involved in cell wall biosynthesis